MTMPSGTNSPTTDGLKLAIAASYVPHLGSVTRHLADGLYAQDVHVHEGWGILKPIRSPALRTTTKGIERTKNFVVRMPDLPVETDIHDHVRECCAAPAMGIGDVSALTELLQAIVAVHADPAEMDMFSAVCPTPWSPFAIMVGVDDAKRTVAAPLDRNLVDLVPRTMRVDMIMDHDAGDTILSFQAMTVNIPSFDLPTPVEAMRILARRAEGISS
jgi:hypothetical protein